MGVLKKDQPEGKVPAEWTAAIGSLDDAVDVSNLVGLYLAVLDDEEQSLIQVAAKCSSNMMTKVFVDQMSRIVDEERRVTHAKLAEQIDQALFADKTAKILDLTQGMDPTYLDWCYSPIIQSGGVYDLKPSAVSNDSNLHAGVILSSLGVRYKSYCSNVGRTYLINPTKEIEENYKFLLELEQYAVSLIKVGSKAREVYESVMNYAQEKKPDLADKLPKNIGFTMGIEFRNSSLLLSAKNEIPLEENMSLNLVVGFQNIENSKGASSKDKVYALLLSDTVMVGQDGGRLLTDAPKDLASTAFYFKDEEEKKPEKMPTPRAGKTAIMKTKLRGEGRDEANTDQARFKSHQTQLLSIRQSDGLKRYSGQEGEESLEPQQVFKRFESYKKDGLLPKEVKSNRIVLDRRAETVILPILGMAVPFHINTIKNVTKNEEGEYLYLRFNFNTPGQVIKKDEPLPFDDPNATFVRSLTFRSTDMVRYTEYYKQITDLKKEVTKREADRKLKEGLVAQDKLIESKRPLAILQDVNIRPPLEGKKLPGDLAVHTNGLRYSSIRGDQKLDILFSNIQHVFFQPCDHELYVIIHFHLKDPIMVGKKKSKDVQFIRDASEASFDETGNRRRRNFNDEDELMAEHEERRRRKKMNNEFKEFAKKVADISSIEADVPIRELGFNGVPFRSNVLLQPTTDCLVYLSEFPFLVINLADVEIVYLERVQFHLKNFDMVFVFKDLRRTPAHINTIPMKQLDPIKEWLDSVDIPVLEGPLNLNWTLVMKSINEDPAGFYQDGGWNTLAAESGGSDEEDQEDSASEFEYASSESEEEEESESDFSGEESEEDEEEDDEFSEEDDESGDDWDTLERKAKDEEMRKKRRGGDSDSEADLKPRKKKR